MIKWWREKRQKNQAHLSIGSDTENAKEKEDQR